MLTFTEPQEKQIVCPSEDEKLGTVEIAWIGPSDNVRFVFYNLLYNLFFNHRLNYVLLETNLGIIHCLQTVKLLRNKTVEARRI